MSAIGDELTAACTRALVLHRDPRLDDVIARLDRVEQRLPPLLVGIAEAARILKVSVATVKRKALTGELPTLKVGTRTLVDVSKMRGLDRDDVARLAEGIRPGR